MERKPRKHTLLENMLELHSFCLDNSSWSQGKTMIVWFASFIELMAYFIIIMHESQLSDSDMLQTIHSFLKFMQLSQVKLISPQLYLVIATIIKLIIAADFALGLALVLGRISVFQSSKIKKYYASFNAYRVFALNTSITKIVIDDLFEAFSGSINLTAIIGNILVLLILILNTLRHCFFLEFEQFSPDNYLVTFERFFYVKMIVAKFILFCLLFVGLNVPSESVKVTSLVMTVILSTAAFVYSFLFKLMAKSSINKSISSLLGTYLALVASLAISSAYSQFNFIVGFVVFGITFLLIVLFRVDSNRINFSDEELRKECFLLEYVNSIMEIEKQCEVDSSHALIAKGLFSYHSLNCVRPICFCRQDTFYVSSKFSFVKANKRENIGLLLKQMIKQKLEDLCLLYPQSSIHKYIYALFCYKRLKNKLLALKAIKSIGSLELDFRIRFKCHRLIRLMARDQDEYINEKFKGKRLEELLQFEKLSSHFIVLIQDIFLATNKFWSFMLYNYSVCPEQFVARTMRILEMKEECESVLKVMGSFSNHSDRVRLLFGFVQRELLNIKITDRLDELEGNLEDRFSFSFSKDFTLFDLSFYKTFLQGTSCIFDIGINPENVGIVLRASNSVEALFQIPRMDLIGKSINILMPEAISARHNSILINMSQSGVLQKKDLSVNTWALQNTTPIEVSIKHRLEITVKADVRLTGLVVHVESESRPRNFILTDDLGFITSISKTLFNRLGINESDILNKLINIAMLSKQLLNMLPVQALVRNSSQRTNKSNQFEMRNIERKVNLTFIKNPIDLSRQIKWFASLKTIGPKMLEDALKNKIQVVYEPKTNSFKAYSRNSKRRLVGSLDSEASINMLDIANEEFVANENIDDLGSENHFESFFAESEIMIDSESPFLPKNQFENYEDYFHVSAYMEIVPKRYASTPNFNAFVFKKIDNTFDTNTTKNKSKAFLPTLTKLVSLKALYSHLNESSNIAERPVEPSIAMLRADKHDSYSQDSAELLLFIRQSSSLFHKETKLIPHKTYPKIRTLFIIITFLYISYFILLFILTFVIKSWILDTSEQITYEFLDVRAFDQEIMTLYSSLLSAYQFKDSRINSTAILLDKIQKANHGFQQNSIISHLFDSKNNGKFTNIMTPGFELRMNNAFLLQNFLYEMIKFLIGTEKVSAFNRDKHIFLREKYKPRLEQYFYEIRNSVKDIVSKSVDRFFYMFLFSYFGLAGSMGFCFFSLAFYLVRIIANITSINDVILHTDDSTIISIISQNKLAERFFLSHFGKAEQPPSERKGEKSFLRSEIKLREMKRKWASRNQKSRKFVFKIMLFYMISLSVFGVLAISDYFLEAGFFKEIANAQEIGTALANDFWSICYLIMTAKDNLLLNSKFDWFTDNLRSELDKALSVAILTNVDGNVAENKVRSYYMKNMCEYVNHTLFPANLPCSQVYNSLLDNNINGIKAILKSKLQFVFTDEDPLKYNFTNAEVTRIDEASFFIEEGFKLILDEWRNDYESMRSSFRVLFVLITILFLALVTVIYLIWAICLLGSLKRHYKHERAVFMNFMPTDILKKSHQLQVQLVKKEVLKIK